jgi:glycosyltransferase involved in cell wall biosynthesis
MPNPQGGMSRHCEELYARIAAMGHDVTVYCTRPDGAPRDGTYRGMRLRRVRPTRVAGMDRARCALAASVDARRGRLDVVHFHALTSSGLCFLARLCRAKVVVTVHRREWQDEKWGSAARAALRASEWITMHAAHLVIAVSRAFEHDLRVRYPSVRDKVRYEANGFVPMPAVAPTALSPLGLRPDGYVLTVGRIVPEKGVHVVIEAFARVLDRGCLIDLAVVGGAREETDYVRSVRAQVEAVGARVHLLGVRGGDELAALFEHARLYVTGAFHEGQPLAVLEAMSAGRAVIATDIPAHRELLGDAGVFVPAGDAAALAQAIEALADDPARLGAIGEAARRRVAETDEYDWDRIAADTEALLQAICVRSPGRSGVPGNGG